MENTKNKRKITLAFSISIVIIFILSGFSLGREMARINIKATGSIAEPILKIERSETISIGNDNTKEIYEFTVKNYDENGNTTEVDLEYYIEILVNLGNDISFKLYKEDEQVEVKENKTKKFTMNKEEKQEDRYKLEIICDEEKQIKELIQKVEMKVYSEQKRK